MLESIARNGVRRSTTSRSIGDNLLETTAINSASGIYGVFRQLLGNSYDADAKLATVKITGSNVEIEDDGHGMSLDEVTNKWLKSGDSAKIAAKQSPGGRPYLGHFGIASASIINIANVYRLITVKDGELTELTEIVGKGLSTKNKIETQTSHVEKRHHGTNITMTELKFVEGPRFSIEGLVRYLSLHLPLGEHSDFRVKVNGDEVKSATFENARVFKFDRTGEHFGHAKGLIYLASGQRSDSGIYVKVHGEVQAEPKKVLHVEKINSRMAPNLIAVIDANGLKGSCRLTRDSFNNTPAYQEFIGVLDEELRKVSRFADQIQNTARSSRNTIDISKQLSVLAGDYLTARIPEVNHHTKFRVETGIADHLVAIYHSTDSRFGINPSHSSITGAPSRPFLYYVLVHGIAEAIALHRHSTNTNLDLLQHKHEVLKKLAKGQKPASLGVSPDVVENAYYKEVELIKLVGLPGPGIQYFVDHKFLARSQHGILGQDVIEMPKRINGYIPLPVFAKDHLKGDEYGKKLANAHYAISTASEHLYTFIVNLGSDGAKCYFVEPVVLGQVTGLIQKLMETSQLDKAGEELQKIGESYLPEEQIRLLFDVKDASDIILNEKLKFDVRTQGKRDQTYHFGDCVKAFQFYREQTKPKVILN